MYYADFHMHSNCSSDAHNTMKDMALSSAKFGLSEICFTDHCDMLDENLSVMKSWSWDEHRKQYQDALFACGNDIKIKFGIELGGACQNAELADEVAAAPDLDFIIGSVHTIPDLGDCYNLEYPDAQRCREIIALYLDELEKTVQWGKFDVLGHITYPLRYMNGRGGIDIDYSEFEERIANVYKNLIENGRGIELNTSNLKNGGKTMPYVELLELYKKCGGEIITLGSDAHRTEHAGSGIPHGYDILGYCGFKYYTVFDHRKPEFIKL